MSEKLLKANQILDDNNNQGMSEYLAFLEKTEKFNYGGLPLTLIFMSEKFICDNPELNKKLISAILDDAWIVEGSIDESMLNNIALSKNTKWSGYYTWFEYNSNIENKDKVFDPATFKFYDKDIFYSSLKALVITKKLCITDRKSSQVKLSTELPTNKFDKFRLAIIFKLFKRMAANDNGKLSNALNDWLNKYYQLFKTDDVYNQFLSEFNTNKKQLIESLYDEYEDLFYNPNYSTEISDEQLTLYSSLALSTINSIKETKHSKTSTNESENLLDNEQLNAPLTNN